MKERPILFSAPMVRAILAGAKTQTRRIVKPRHDYFVEDGVPYFESYVYADPECPPVPCPYGAPGDRLWVKESIRKMEPPDMPPHEDGTPLAYSQYVADNVWTVATAWPWKREVLPGMFMPRGLRRITLEVTRVRVERLHDITEEDARAEGVTPYVPGHGAATDDELSAEPGLRSPRMHRFGFEQVWRDINGSPSWAANPWVWVVEFRPVVDEHEVG